MTRRTLLSAAVGAALGRASPFSPPETPRPRIAISKLFLPEHRELLDAFLRGYDELRRLPIEHAWSWESHKLLHAAHCGFPEDVHINWHFLSWHRCFVYYHERLLAHLAKAPWFRLPYWDWDYEHTIPRSYLCRNGPLWRERNSGDELQIAPNVTVENLATLLAPARFDSADGLGGMVNREGRAAASVPHRGIHATVSGDFSTFERAGGEPLFYIHHASIDRYWEIWARRHGGSIQYPNAWRTKELEVAGQRFSAGTIADTAQLGYCYDSYESPVQFTQPAERLSVTASKNELAFSRRAVTRITEILTRTIRGWATDIPVLYLSLSGIRAPQSPTRAYTFFLEPLIGDFVRLHLGTAAPFQGADTNGNMRFGATFALNPTAVAKWGATALAALLLGTKLRLIFTTGEGALGDKAERASFESASLELQFLRRP
jgi:hypothetical protein